MPPSNAGRLSIPVARRIKVQLIIQNGKRGQGAVELDHRVPLKRKGTNDMSNLQVLCLPCHDGKTNENGESGPIRNMNDSEWREAGKPQDWGRKKRLLRRWNQRQLQKRQRQTPRLT